MRYGKRTGSSLVLSWAISLCKLFPEMFSMSQNDLFQLNRKAVLQSKQSSFFFFCSQKPQIQEKSMGVIFWSSTKFWISAQLLFEKFEEAPKYNKSSRCQKLSRLFFFFLLWWCLQITPKNSFVSAFMSWTVLILTFKSLWSLSHFNSFQLSVKPSY